MLQKTLNGEEILEIVKKSLKDEGLDFVGISSNILFSKEAKVTFDVKVHHKVSSHLQYQPGVRSL